MGLGVAGLGEGCDDGGARIAREWRSLRRQRSEGMGGGCGGAEVIRSAEGMGKGMEGVIGAGS
jgi:hypothetical protein